MGRPDLLAFAGTVVHELRTPLSVVSGEVDLALARERTPAAYRDALTRIGERVAELVDLTADFALLGEARQIEGPAVAAAVTVRALFGALADRYGPRRGSPVVFEVEHPDRRVAGDDVLLGGALALVIEHAVRHRRDGAGVRVRAVAAAEAAVTVLVDAPPTGFSTATWHGLTGRRHEPFEHGQLRLETAVRIIDACGGSIGCGGDAGAEAVRVTLAARDHEEEGAR